MRSTFAFVLACACSVAAAQSPATSPPVPATSIDSTAQRAASRVSEADIAFLREAEQLRHTEVRAASLALGRVNDAGIRRYADRMLQDHTMAGAQLHRLGRTKNVELPTGPSVAQRSKLSLLQARSGERFDSEYLKDFGQDAHRTAIALYQRQLRRGSDPDIKAFAKERLAVLQDHRLMAQRMSAQPATGAALPSEQVQAAPSVRTASPTSDSTSAVAPTSISPVEINKARGEIDRSVQVVQRMKADPAMTALLERAKGVFILPQYGRLALGVGVQGGQGVLVVRQGDDFSNPVFYTLGGLSLGAQVGASGGEIAMLLMTDEAVREFRSDQNFSLNADAGLTISTYSSRAQASAGKVEDVVVWTSTEGAYAGLSLGANRVAFDAKANRAYYGRDQISAAQILEGAVPNPGSNVLGRVLGV